MATLLSSASNGTGTGSSHSGPATVFVHGTWDSATVVVELSSDDTNYVKADNISPAKGSRLSSDGCCTINAYGTYYIRCVVAGGGGSESITAVSTQ